MRLIINGESCDLQVSAGLSLQQLLQQLGYLHPSPHVQHSDTLCTLSSGVGNFIVAVNQQIVSAALYATTDLNEDDCIDILGAITGG